MLRSSRIPPLLNRICTDGIISSYLITIDGELLGCSNIQPSKTNTSTSTTTSTSAKKNGNDIPSMQINVPSSSEEMMMMIEEPSNTNTNTNSTNTNTNTWENMDPSDIGALVAEVVEDYKRLGLELALLTPSSDVNGNGSGNGNGNSSGNKQNSAAVSAGGNTSGGSIGIGIGNGNGIGKDMNGGSGKDKERGKLNCLIVEMEKGLVGIAAATSDTYVVGLTDSTAEHGSLKMKLLSLSAYVRDAFLPLDKGSL